METNIGSIDFNRLPDMNYILQYIYESQPARLQYQELLYRVNLAAKGLPWKNLYQEEIIGNINKVKDCDKRARFLDNCIKVPEGKDFTIANAVHNRANQMSTGVDTYEYQVNDPWMIINDETEDLLAAKCSQDYVENKLDIMASVFSTDLTMYGVTAVYISYDPVKDRNIVTRINPKNLIWDTRYSSTGQERFRGYNTMISWKKLKEMVENSPAEHINLNIEAPQEGILQEKRNGKQVSVYINKGATYKNRKIRSLNGLDVYVSEMNKIAQASQFQGLENTWEFMHDLQSCYNTQYYQSMATDPRAQTEGNYVGDDVMLTVIFDMDKKIEYKVINNRYVISANGESYHRVINFMARNVETKQMESHFSEFKLGCPIVMQFEAMDSLDKQPWPTSPVINMLDMHDELCALRSKRRHLVNLISQLRVVSDSADADSLQEALNIEGIILDDLQGDVQNLQFVYDWNPLDSQIAYYENTIREYLCGYSQFDAMQMMGDRASAAESGMAQGAIAQGLATHQNAIMQLYADIARQCIADRVTYSPNNTFAVTNNGNYKSLTIQEMALTAVINVIPKNAKKVQEARVAANALQAMATLGGQGAITPNGQAELMQIALFNTLPRKMAATFVNSPRDDQVAVQAAMLEGQNMANMLAQNNAAYQQNPMAYEVDNVMLNNSPDQVDAIISQMAQDQGGGLLAADGSEMQVSEEVSPEGGAVDISGLEMISQPGAMTSDIEGMTPDSGSDLSNPNTLI